jgi:hypothetical protein
MPARLPLDRMSHAGIGGGEAQCHIFTPFRVRQSSDLHTGQTFGGVGYRGIQV